MKMSGFKIQRARILAGPTLPALIEKSGQLRKRFPDGARLPGEEMAKSFADSDNEIPCNARMVLQYSAPTFVVYQFFKC
jgi:hypothetical protein